jgi:hypothetical protein
MKTDDTVNSIIAVLCDEFTSGYDYAQWLHRGKIPTNIRRISKAVVKIVREENKNEGDQKAKKRSKARGADGRV